MNNQISFDKVLNLIDDIEGAIDYHRQSMLSNARKCDFFLAGRHLDKKHAYEECHAMMKRALDMDGFGKNPPVEVGLR